MVLVIITIKCYYHKMLLLDNWVVEKVTVVKIGGFYGDGDDDEEFDRFMFNYIKVWLREKLLLAQLDESVEVIITSC